MLWFSTATELTGDAILREPPALSTQLSREPTIFSSRSPTGRVHDEGLSTGSLRSAATALAPQIRRAGGPCDRDSAGPSSPCHGCPS
jgi:hypothetical protein